MTQSLLSSWMYYMEAPDDKADGAYASFLSTLRREKKEPTKAMLEGRRFEAMVNRLVSGHPIQTENPAWAAAAKKIAGICAGGQPQVPVSGTITLCGMDFVLYGVCDYVRAGIIKDIKKVTRYEYGKYQNSPQHPMYLHLIPEARRFDYLIFDGGNVYIETYRREDCRPIEEIISGFIRYLDGSGLLPVYREVWRMNPRREELAAESKGGVI